MPQSRDGKFVYFCAHSSGSGQVWKAPASDGAPVRVTRAGGCESRGSPDGKYLYYVKPNSSDLWRMPLDGGGEVVIAELRRHGEYRYISPLGKSALSAYGQEIVVAGQAPQ